LASSCACSGIDARALDAALFDLGEECDPAFLDHRAMPGGLHEGDPLRFCKSRVRENRWTIDRSGRIFYFGNILQHLIHGFPLSGPESGHTERRAAMDVRLSRPFSFIRTLTVGFGIAPNLLTLPQSSRKALAGLGYVTLTAGGDFHPALRTSAARYERPRGIMANGGSASKDLRYGDLACPHVVRAKLRPGWEPGN